MKPHLRVTIQTLLAHGTSQREIERLTGIDRKTIRRYERDRGRSGGNSPGWPPALTRRKSRFPRLKLPHGHRLRFERRHARPAKSTANGSMCKCVLGAMPSASTRTWSNNTASRTGTTPSSGFVRELKAREPRDWIRVVVMSTVDPRFQIVWQERCGRSAEECQCSDRCVEPIGECLGPARFDVGVARSAQRVSSVTQNSSVAVI